MKVEVSGMKEMFDAFKNLDKEAKKQVRKLVKETFKPVLEASKDKCPVKTGALKESLKLKVRQRKTSSSATVESGKDQYYSVFVEYGHKIGKRPSKLGKLTKGDGRQDIQAKPFLRPGFDENKDKVLNSFTDGLLDAIEKAWVKK